MKWRTNIFVEESKNLLHRVYAYSFGSQLPDEAPHQIVAAGLGSRVSDHCWVTNQASNGRRHDDVPLVLDELRDGQFAQLERSHNMNLFDVRIR